MNTLNITNPQLSRLIASVPVIGVDIDGTLADTIGVTLAEVRGRFGDVLEFSQWKTWNPHQISELQAQGITTIQHTIDLFYGILKDGGTQVVKPINDSVEGIKRLHGLGKELIALSGRMEDSRSYTTSWLKDHYLGVFNKILFTDHDTPKQIPKYELAREHGIGLMIEDNAHYAVDLANHGIPTILLEVPWNVDIDTSVYPDIYRVKDWQEIVGLLR